MEFPRRASSWYDPLRAGAWITVALGLLVILALSVFVAWGRWKKAPVAAR